MSAEPWDAAIIGAGPAGAVSAYLLARRGWRVVLVEKSKWPREKVCGGCINADAVQMLRDVGLGHVLADGVHLDRFALHAGGRQLQVKLPAGIAISRAELDARLVAAAVAEGCTFLPGASARLLRANPTDSFRHMNVAVDGSPVAMQARIVLACDGIAGTFLDSEPWAAWRIAPRAWFGVSTMVEQNLVERGTIAMHVGRGGYVGLAKLADGRVHLAAALDPDACRHVGGPGGAVSIILKTPLDELKYRGTTLLTRRRNAFGGHRVLAVGDACGYVEPFTGEGIAWAVRGAREVVALLTDSAAEWSGAVPARWARRHRAVITSRWCHLLRHVARRPALAAAAIAVANTLPALAHAVAQRVGHQSFSGSPHIEGVPE